MFQRSYNKKKNFAHYNINVKHVLEQNPNKLSSE